MILDDTHTYVLRLSGTMSMKSPKTRHRFHRRLEYNLRDALDRAGIAYDLRDEWSRMYVDADDPRTADILSTVCGIQGVRPSMRWEWETLEDIVEKGTELYADTVRGETFAVDASRVGVRENFPFDSVDVNETLGAELVEAGGAVDLDHPDVEVNLEIDEEAVYFFDREIAGPAGLPLGVEGRALALTSGGFDSAVASWRMLKRGVELDFLFFNLAGPSHERGVRRVMKQLVDRWAHGTDPTLHVVDFRPVVADIKTSASDHYWQLLLKRLMVRAADRIALRGGYPALVTGEAIGQVSTQTLGNLAAIEAPIEVPILRPLVGSNKDDIIQEARDVDMYDVTEHVPEFCALDGGHPVTNSTPERLDREEAKMDLDVLQPLLEDREMYEVRSLSLADDAVDVQTDTLPDEATFLDLRSEREYDQWHPSEAVHVPFETAVEQYAMLPEQPTWVLYCDVGLKSALVAEKMRRAGFDAHSFRGGVPRLKQKVDSADVASQ